MANGRKCQKTGFGILCPFIRSKLTGVIKFNWRQETEIIAAPIAKLVLPAAALLGKRWPDSPTGYLQRNWFSVTANSADLMPEKSLERKMQDER
jgi:hypothetical protein